VRYVEVSKVYATHGSQQGQYSKFTFEQQVAIGKLCLTTRQPGGFLPLSDVLVNLVSSHH